MVDAADRAKLPLAYLAVPAVVAAGITIGRQVAIRPSRFDDFLVVANLWGAIVGPSGDMKSSAIAEAVKPLARLAAAAAKEYERGRVVTLSAVARNEIEIQLIKDKLKVAAKKGDTAAVAAAEGDLGVAHAEVGKLLERAEPRYVTQDSTVAKLGELLRDNPRGLLVLRDELTGLLRAMDQPGHEGEREFYLEAWNGTGAYTFDRIGRGTIHIPALCLSLLGGIQPGKLNRYVGEAVVGGWDADGLLQRLQLLVWPDFLPPWKRPERWPDTQARQVVRGIFEKLADFPLPACKPGDDGLRFVTFNPEAQQLYDKFRDDLEQDLRGGLYLDAPAFGSHLAKYRSLLPALALIFHLVDYIFGVIAAADDTGSLGPDDLERDPPKLTERYDRGVLAVSAVVPVSLMAAQLAAAWCEFLELHSRKVYRQELQPGSVTAGRLVERISKGQIADGVSLRDVYRHGWHGLTTVDALRPGLAVLEDAGWLRVREVSSGVEGGRPTEVIRLHPDLGAAGRGLNTPVTTDRAARPPAFRSRWLDFEPKVANGDTDRTVRTSTPRSSVSFDGGPPESSCPRDEAVWTAPEPGSVAADVPLTLADPAALPDPKSWEGEL
ncbi:MAG: YfjI family protein [Candidatus Dormibacteria bacterium]